jgi:hypothetical protein
MESVHYKSVMFYSTGPCMIPSTLDVAVWVKCTNYGVQQNSVAFSWQLGPNYVWFSPISFCTAYKEEANGWAFPHSQHSL